MAWFGDTFGDGLSSLKGQITKITKEVLSEDPLAATSFEGRIKQLEDDCAKHANEVERLRNENNRLKEGGSFELSEDQIQNICEMENQMAELVSEKTSLTKALEDLDAEHQRELDVLIKDREALRHLANSHSTRSQQDGKNSLGSDSGRIEELTASLKQLELQNDMLFEESKSKDLELRQCLVEAEKLKKAVAGLELKLEQQAGAKLANQQADHDTCLRGPERIRLQTDLIDLQKENDQVKPQIDEFKRQVDAKDLQLKALDISLDTLRGEREELNLRLEELTNQYEASKSSMEVLTSENAELRRTAVESEREDLSSIVHALTNENEKLKESLRASEKLIVDYKTKETTAAKNEEAFEKLQLYNVHLQGKFSELEATMTHLQDELTDAAQTSIEVLTKENTELQQRLNETLALQLAHATQVSQLSSANEQLSHKLEETEAMITSLLEQNQENRGIKNAIGDLTQENLELQKRVRALAENDSLVIENEELKQHIDFLEQENIASTEKLEEEGKKLKDRLQEFEGLAKENEVLTTRQQENDGDSMRVLLVENGDLKEKLVKLEALVARREERDHLVSGTLGLEIRKLKGLVGRIQREFLMSSAQRADSAADPDDINRHEESSGEEVMIESQTDDVKRLQQDVSQMTEIIKMIDQGLTAIYQDKSRLEKELAVLQGVAARTEQELTATVKVKRQLETNLQEWAAAVASRDEAIQSLNYAKSIRENEVEALKSERESLAKLSKAHEDALKQLETDKSCLEGKLIELERSNGEWKTRLDELQSLYQRETKRNEELCVKKDEKITELMRSRQPEAEQVEGNPEQESGEVQADRLEKNELERGLEVSASPERSELQDQVARLVEENSDLKMLVQQLRENIFAMNTRVPSTGGDAHQHRRSHSQVEDQRAELQVEHARYQALLAQHQSLLEKEGNLRREADRLRAHLVEVEEHYTEETVTAEKELGELRAKLSVAEEQLRSSNTVYKSANVRSTQHLEALQTQIQLMSVQRNDLQLKLSDAEDNAQKQAAALASLQLVLEQFQLDKQRELQTLDEKHHYQMELGRRRAAELEHQVETIHLQLTEAKAGLKAALRLGEQLEKKSHLIAELEEDLKKARADLAIAESRLSTVNQSTAGKIDKSLVKNLMVGYLGAQGDHKAQALKILASVLELSAEERSRAGVEGQGGWLAHILHPSAAFAAPTESLSQAFVRFLESESRPQPQLKLLAEPQLNQTPPKRAPLVLSDLVLPSVAPTQVGDPGLSDMLKDS